MFNDNVQLIIECISILIGLSAIAQIFRRIDETNWCVC